MGNTNNSETQRLQFLYSQYIPNKLHHQQFGDCTLLQSKLNPKEKIILKEYTYTDEFVYRKSKKNFEIKQSMQSEYLLKIINTFSITEKQLCGQFHKIYLIIENPQTKLDSVQLVAKDYWPILFGYIRGLETLQKNSVTHEQITMKSLYLPPKVCDPSIFDHNSNFQTIIQNNRQPDIYLSPELLNALKNNEWQPQYNPYKSDVFTLGMCMLQAILQKNSNECYHHGILLEDVLNQRIGQLYQQYPQQLADIINNMLQLTELQRPDFIQLSQYLDQKYQESLTVQQIQIQPKYEFKKSQAVKKPSLKDIIIDSSANINNTTNTTQYSIKNTTMKNEEILLLPMQSDQMDVLNYVKLNQKPAQSSKYDENIDPQDQFLDDDSVVNSYQQQKFNQPLKDQSDFNNRNISNLQLKLSEIQTKPQLDIPQSQQQFSLPFDLPQKQSQYSAFSSQCQQGEQFVNEEYQDGSKYQGFKLNGMRNGQGIFYYKDGGYYDGNWEYNHMHGQGVLYYSNGNPAYQGCWNQDKFQGYGVLYNEMPANMTQPYDYQDFDLVEDYWVKYEGEFNDDNKEGQGTLYLSNGERFSGQFLKDYINGFGLFYTQQNKIIEGRWSNNKLVK